MEIERGEVYMFAERYDRNKPIISRDQQEVLQKSKVALCGLGGLGGWQALYLARLGIGNLLLIDGDDFHASNLNRQAFAFEENLGQAKVFAAEQGLKKINSELQITSLNLFLDQEDQVDYFQGVDLILDGSDNIKLRTLIESYANQLDIAWVHGAISGWEGQYGIFLPGVKAMEKLYPLGSATELITKGNLSFVAANVASQQVNLALQHFLGLAQTPYNKVFRADYLTGETFSFDL